MKEYKDKMDQICWTEDGKENLIKRVKAESKTNKESVRKRMWVKQAAVIGILCVFGTSTVLAAGFHKTPWELLHEIFGTQKQQIEIIDAIGSMIGASDVSNGIIMTVEASIADSRNLCIVYSFSREDGEPLILTAPEGYMLDKLWLESGNQSLDKKSKSVCNQAYKYDHANEMVEYYDRIVDQKDGKVVVMRTYTMSGRIPKKMKIEEKFEGIKCPSATEYNNPATLLQGEWNLKFKIEYENSSVRIPVRKKLPLKYMDYEIESVDISQLGVNIQGRQTANLESQQSNVGYPDKIYLKLQDGTTVDLCSAYELPVTSIEKEKGEREVTVSGNILYDEIIPLDKIKSITIGDEEFILSMFDDEKKH